MLFFPPEIAAMAMEAAEQRKVQPIDCSEFATRAAPVAALPEQKTDETCYLQYTSGSTRLPPGVAVPPRPLLHNLSAHSHSLRTDDRREGKKCVRTCRSQWAL